MRRRESAQLIKLEEVKRGQQRSREVKKRRGIRRVNEF